MALTGTGVHGHRLVVGRLAVRTLLASVRRPGRDRHERAPGSSAVAQVHVRGRIGFRGIERRREHLDLVPRLGSERLADDVELARLRVVDDRGIARDAELRRKDRVDSGSVRERRERGEALGHPVVAAIVRERETAAVVELPVVPGAGEQLPIRAHPERLLVVGVNVVRNVDGRRRRTARRACERHGCRDSRHDEDRERGGDQHLLFHLSPFPKRPHRSAAGDKRPQRPHCGGGRRCPGSRCQ